MERWGKKEDRREEGRGGEMEKGKGAEREEGVVRTASPSPPCNSLPHRSILMAKGFDPASPRSAAAGLGRRLQTLLAVKCIQKIKMMRLNLRCAPDNSSRFIFGDEAALADLYIPRFTALG